MNNRETLSVHVYKQEKLKTFLLMARSSHCQWSYTSSDTFYSSNFFFTSPNPFYVPKLLGYLRNFIRFNQTPHSIQIKLVFIDFATCQILNKNEHTNQFDETKKFFFHIFLLKKTKKDLDLHCILKGESHLLIITIAQDVD